MQEEKKIRIRKNFSGNGTNAGKAVSKPVFNASKIMKSLDLLEQTVKKIESKYKAFGFYDSKEEDFFENYSQKPVVLELSNGKVVEGSLEGVDKFRICLNMEGIQKYFFKHAVLCYYPRP